MDICLEAETNNGANSHYKLQQAKCISSVQHYVMGLLKTVTSDEKCFNFG